MEPKWYYYFNKKGEDSLMNHCKKLDLENILVCQELESRKYAKFKNFATFSKFFHSTPEHQRCFYEMIRSEIPRKPYFDIDLPEEKDFDINKLKDILIELLGDKTKILVFTSHTETKKSYHLVIDNLAFSDHKQLQNFYEKTVEKLDESDREYVDGSVYKSVQQFRMVGSQKYLKSNTKILAPDLSHNYTLPKNLVSNPIGIFNYNLAISLISNTSYCSFIQGYDFKKEENSNIGIGTSCEGDVEDILRIFYSLYSPDDFKFSECKERNGNLLIILRRLNPTFCKKCERIHEHENPFLITIGEFRSIYFYCRRKDKSDSEYLGSLGIPKIENISIEDVPNIEEMEKDNISNKLEEMKKDRMEYEDISNKLEELSYSKSKTPTRKSRSSILKNIKLGSLIH